LKEKFIPIQSVFDLYENFLSHMTQNPWAGAWDYFHIIRDGSQHF
jgi:hypothetical protein